LIITIQEGIERLAIVKLRAPVLFPRFFVYWF